MSDVRLTRKEADEAASLILDYLHENDNTFDREMLENVMFALKNAIEIEIVR